MAKWHMLQKGVSLFLRRTNNKEDGASICTSRGEYVSIYVYDKPYNSNASNSSSQVRL